MNINPSRYLRVVSNFFFIFTLFFSGMAQASVLQKMIQRLPDVLQSKIEKVFGTLKSRDVYTEDIAQETLRELGGFS